MFGPLSIWLSLAVCCYGMSRVLTWYVARAVRRAHPNVDECRAMQAHVVKVIRMHRARPDWAPGTVPVCRICWTPAPCPTVVELTTNR